MPAISVIIPTFNHENYIDSCIQSILSQTCQDFEIIITDDGSVDRTIERIENYHDPRISLFKHNRNKGASSAANNCLAHAKGNYIAMISSDDIWLPEKLEKELLFLESNNDFAAVFTKIIWIDESDNEILKPDFFYKDIFDVENRTRFEWLNYFFYNGNCLCHPSSLVRRSIYNEVQAFNPRLASLPDLDLWIKICLRYDIHILEDRLVKFRHFIDEKNASGNNLINNTRFQFETFHLLDNFLDIKTIDILALIFPKITVFNNFGDNDIPFLLGKLALETEEPNKKFWGLNQIYTYLGEGNSALSALERHNFGYPDFFEQTGKNNVFERKDLSEKFPIPKLNLFNKIYNRINYSTDRQIIKSSHLFDETFYTEQNPDVYINGIDPLKHYILYGGFEERNPNPTFSNLDYYKHHPEAKKDGINPLVHYLKNSKRPS